MKKIILLVIIVLLMTILGISMFKGINIGKYRVSSVEDIKTADTKLDNEIQNVELLNRVNYAEKKNTLSSAFNEFETKKNEYYDLVNSKTIKEIEDATRQEKYDIEFLWTRIGFYTQANNLWLKAILTNPSNGIEGQYDIKIAIRGEYAGVEQFIRGIEKDVNLGFRIEEFSMIPFLTEEEKELQDKAIKQEEKDKYPTGKTVEAKLLIRNVSVNLVNLVVDNSETTDNTTSKGEN